MLLVPPVVTSEQQCPEISCTEELPLTRRNWTHAHLFTESQNHRI